jgi:predicted metal-dependent peptidase
MDNEISRFVLSLRRSYPFFGSLALFADYQFTQEIKLFSTNGRTIRINPEHFSQCNNKQKVGLLLHLLLHCALLHAVRRKNRNERIWGIASDIAVNNIILEGGFFPPPAETVIDQKFAGSSTEEIYERLSLLPPQSQALSQETQVAPSKPDRISGDKENIGPIDHRGKTFNKDLDENKSLNRKQHNHSLEQHWKSAQHRATTVDRIRSKTRGEVPAGFLREWDIARSPMIDWRTQLWRHIVRTPCDFSGFDRRFLHQGLYLEELAGESLKVDVVVDTSGSINEQELGQFLAEVNSIRRAYEHINIRLYYVDAEVNGPYPLDGSSSIPSPIGDGGTDFSTFFDATDRIDQSFEPPLCVYFTDGDGYFPNRTPKRSILWVVTAGGESDLSFPFGTVTRLSYI